MGKRYLWMLLWLASCASAIVFDESSNGKTVEVVKGRAFSISLSGSSWTIGTTPVIVRPAGRSHDDSADRDVFQFKAETIGEEELRFSRPSAPVYVLRVKVTAPSEYQMMPHNP